MQDVIHCIIDSDSYACQSLAGVLQAVYTSAVTKAQYVRDATLADAAEAEKLLQRQSAAREQYDQGLAKLRATSRQLQSLASRVGPQKPWLMVSSQEVELCLLAGTPALTSMLPVPGEGDGAFSRAPH